MITDAADVIAAHIMPEPQPDGPRRYVVRFRHADVLTHATALTLPDAQAEARQWRARGREVIVCELREVPLTAS